MRLNNIMFIAKGLPDSGSSGLGEETVTLALAGCLT